LTGIWILGATGRTGRVIARRLTGPGSPPPELVLVARREDALRETALELGGQPRTVVAATLDAVRDRLR
jgi:NADP-dependent 3-hydroxy acid dehydrogenase YdfG